MIFISSLVLSLSVLTCMCDSSCDSHQDDAVLLQKTAEKTTAAKIEAQPAVDTFQGQKKLMFVHIPKNAGTTIEDLGKQNGILWGRFAMTGFIKIIWKPEPLRTVWWHIPPSQFPAKPNPYKDPSAELFCVVRDPWRRLVSEFIWERFFGNILIPTPGCDIPAFRNWMNRSLTAIESGNITGHDCHLLPQSSYIKGPAQETGCQHMLQASNLTAEFNQLMEKFDLKLRMTEEVSTISNAANQQNDSAQCQELHDAPVMTVFDEQLRSRVRKAYKADFELLGDNTLL